MESSKLQINELATILNQYFAWNKARMDCFVGMLVGLLKTRNINLVEIATGFAGEALPGLRYRRIQRFIHGYGLDFDQVAGFVMSLFGFKNAPFYLAMDRTNWQCTPGHKGQEELEHLNAGRGLQRRSGSSVLAAVEQERQFRHA